MAVAFVFVKARVDKWQEVNDSLEKLVKPEPELGVRAVYREPLFSEYDSVLKLEGDFMDITKYIAEMVKPMDFVEDIKAYYDINKAAGTKA
ncbi:MAG: hypothetical protein HY438_01705 [DPANN group archaeon]|nr:hypothetical protein [DPANN group archaeon]